MSSVSQSPEDEELLDSTSAVESEEEQPVESPQSEELENSEISEKEDEPLHVCLYDCSD